MAEPYLRLRFKNRAGTVQNFTIPGDGTTDRMEFDSYECPEVRIFESPAPDQAITVGGYASQVTKRDGRKAEFTLLLDRPVTQQKVLMLEQMVTVDRFIVEVTVFGGNGNYSGSNRITPANYTFDALVTFPQQTHRSIELGQGMGAVPVSYVATETRIFSLPTAQDVIVAAPSGGGGN